MRAPLPSTPRRREAGTTLLETALLLAVIALMAIPSVDLLSFAIRENICWIVGSGGGSMHDDGHCYRGSADNDYGCGPQNEGCNRFF